MELQDILNDFHPLQEASPRYALVMTKEYRKHKEKYMPNGGREKIDQELNELYPYLEARDTFHMPPKFRFHTWAGKPNFCDVHLSFGIVVIIRYDENNVVLYDFGTHGSLEMHGGSKKRNKFRQK